MAISATAKALNLLGWRHRPQGIAQWMVTMWHHINVNLADLLFSVSETMDLSDPSLVDHQLRTAYVTCELARAANLNHQQTELLFAAALLHDIGALSPEEKIGIHIAEDLRPEAHCHRGGNLFREAFWLAPSAPVIDWHHTPYHVHTSEGRSIGDSAVLCAQMLMLGDVLERSIDRDEFILHQVDTVCARLRKLSGAVLHPDVVQLFEQVSRREDFWLELVAKDLSRRLRARSLLRSIDLDYPAARAMSGVLKDITDFRSRFTASHSAGVACCARQIAERLSFSGKDLQQIELAGFLHDLGKLVVPNAILCKPGALTAWEYAVVRQHPYYTYRILSQVRGFEQIAEWAAFHHERLDGSGYPGGMDHQTLSLGAKVVAVADVAAAVAERRPYREPGGERAVLSALNQMGTQGLLDSTVIEALADNYVSIMGTMQAAQDADEQRYQSRYAQFD